jgi:stalled ribosome rescue protein Dom34
MKYHAVVWLDYQLAKIIGFDMHDADRVIQTVHGHGDPHIHHKAGVVGSGHAHSDPAFFKAIADDLQDVQEILVVGPAETKQGLIAYLRRERPELALHITGSEPLGHSSDGEIVEFAREFFRRADRMTPQL